MANVFWDPSQGFLYYMKDCYVFGLHGVLWFMDLGFFPLSAKFR